jgi:hypothetical protein
VRKVPLSEIVNLEVVKSEGLIPGSTFGLKKSDGAVEFIPGMKVPFTSPKEAVKSKRLNLALQNLSQVVAH